MHALQETWSIYGGRVLAAFDLSEFQVICDVGGEPAPPGAALSTPGYCADSSLLWVLHWVLPPLGSALSPPSPGCCVEYFQGLC